MLNSISVLNNIHISRSNTCLMKLNQVGIEGGGGGESNMSTGKIIISSTVPFERRKYAAFLVGRELVFRTRHLPGACKWKLS